MKKITFFSITTIFLLLFSTKSFSQTANLGVLTSFEAFTAIGDVTNSGGTVTGDVGTNLGDNVGFGIPYTYANTAYSNNTVTEQVRFDLFRLYIHLNNLPVNFPNPLNSTSIPHPASFGGGETLIPGVYTIASAATIAGALTLDGQGDSDAFFVIKMNGAMTVSAGSTMTLTGGAQSCNVFWIAADAIPVESNAIVIGTLLAKTGAVGLGAGTTLDGRMFSMGGAINIGTGSIATPPPGTITIPIFCETDCSPTPALDILGSLSDFALFTSAGIVTNIGLSGVNGLVGTNAGGIVGYTNGPHVGTEEIGNALTAQAALDLDNAYVSLMEMTATGTHPLAYYNETVTPGVYDIAGAGSLNGIIVLDALADPDAIFVFRFTGAFNITELSKMVLTNGAKRCNVFWLGGAGVTSGAINIGAFSQVVGNFIAHGGASNSATGVFLAGRQFSTTGAVNTDTAIIFTNPECITSTVLDPNPSALALVKTASIGGSGEGVTGEVITYTFTVTNTGPEALTNITVTDTMAGLTITGGPITSLETGVSNSDITATYMITAADVNAGNVTNTATATDSNGVTDISGTANDNDYSTVTNTNSVLNVEDFNIKNAVIQPNPFNDRISIQLPTVFDNDSFEIKLFDLNGRVILNYKSQNVNNGLINIENLNNLKQGVYLIKITNNSDGESNALKLIKY
jgi:hypothetical protein|tara:strand:+ start:7210 stop:9264 length:2055 start_codon:yes stop_codon:yes gene_type:complete